MSTRGVDVTLESLMEASLGTLEEITPPVARAVMAVIADDESTIDERITIIDRIIGANGVQVTELDRPWHKVYGAAVLMYLDNYDPSADTLAFDLKAQEWILLPVVDASYVEEDEDEDEDEDYEEDD